VALDQAREARLQILQIMKQAIEDRATELSSYARASSRSRSTRQDPRRHRQGGVVIRGIQEETGTTIEIEDDGTVSIACVSAEGRRGGEKAHPGADRGRRSRQGLRRHSAAAAGLRRIVQVLPGRDGLLHISQISHERVNAVSDHLKEGQVVKVKVRKPTTKEGYACP